MRKRFFLAGVMLIATGQALIANDNECDIQKMTEAEREAFISAIEFIELDAEPELGFEVLKYLPNDFDAYKGMIFDMKEIHFEEVQEAIELELETKGYLPDSFNPYVGQ